MNELLEKIVSVARYCGQIMADANRSDSMIDQKSGHANFVTVYDRKIQQILQKQLLDILPEAVFVGEEEDIHASIQNGYAFIVDPIDGTTNFIKDYQASCVSIGLTFNGEPYMGVVYNPYLNEMYTAVKNQGAFLNQRPIHVSTKPLSQGLVLFGTSPYYQELHQKAFELAYHYFKQAMDLRRSGSAAIDLCALAAGRAELFFELRLSPWDYAAAGLICQEAGGVVTTQEQTPFTLDRPCSILATNQIVRRELSSINMI